MLFTDLNELKSLMEIDPRDVSEDKNLLIINRVIAEWFSEVLNRDPWYKVRTRYYDGTGTQKLSLRDRPLYPLTGPDPALPFTALQVSYDPQGYWGQGVGAFSGDATNRDLVLGVDYAPVLDWDSNNDGVDDASRSGILVRLNDYWQKPTVRQRGLLSPFLGPDTGSIRVISTAGYTTDLMPAQVRMAADLAVARLRYIFPLGVELGGEGYEERSISLMADMRQYIMTPTVKGFLFSLRNWRW